jgi:hypothetical protein
MALEPADTDRGRAKASEHLSRRSAVTTWRLVFYSERRRVLARYAVEAGTAAKALGLGREALLTQHPPTAARRPTSLVEQAQREQTR